eukprot:Skav231373  [mRNA]  locus=scaffold1586:748449:753841:+ [translate_table: standard]
MWGQGGTGGGLGGHDGEADFISTAWGGLLPVGLTDSTNHLRIGIAMDLTSVSEWSLGQRATLVVHVHSYDEGVAYGVEHPFGTQVAFKLVGRPQPRMTLYHVAKTDRMLGQAIFLELDDRFDPLGLRDNTLGDFGAYHDVLCGLGGFSSALDFLSFTPVTAVDWNSLALRAFALNHGTHVIQGDIASPSTVHAMHTKQLEMDLQPWILAGVPCQPYSTQGHLGRSTRSKTCPAVLRAAFHLGAVGLLLECVPEAMQDRDVQQALRSYAELTGAVVHQRILHLHSVWPARRSRWLALVVPAHFEFHGFDELPVSVPRPVLRDLFPDLWPQWSPEDEQQLAWTELELQAFRCPDFGPVERRPAMHEPCPTALHSWGSVLYKCPCGCREQGISAASLRRKGLRGIEIKSASWPHHSRHVHPRELQLILAFSPREQVLADCRAQLVLFGNAVSPVHAIWVMASFLAECGFLPVGQTPESLLRAYLHNVLRWRDLTWPPSFAGASVLLLECNGSEVQVTFHPTQTVGELVHAEKILQEHPNFWLSCDGEPLPTWAYLQPRKYTLHVGTSEFLCESMVVPIIIEHLGLRAVYLIPAGMTCAAFLKWADLPSSARVVTEAEEVLAPGTILLPWQWLTVQQHPDDVAFELAMKLEGFGAGDCTESGNHLTLSESRCSTGMWRFDQVVKSDLLLTWIGSGFAPLTCWLPSFAAAVVELWPNTADDMIRTWVAVSNVRIFAVVWETWGWNLVQFDLCAQALQVVFYEPEGLISGVASHLASRVRGIAARELFFEAYQTPITAGRGHGRLCDVLATLDSVLGSPAPIAATLHALRVGWEQDFHGCEDMCITPTLPFDSFGPQQLPLPPCAESATVHRHGLKAGFLLDFVGALDLGSVAREERHVAFVFHQGKLWGQSGQVDFATFGPSEDIVWLFTLVDQHWTLAQCFMVGDMLVMTVFDGLRLTPLSVFATVAARLKRAWKANHVHLSSTCTFPQTRSDTCGTIALAHFAHSVGVITYEQAMNLELLHDGFAFLSNMPCFDGPTGFGADDEVIIRSLEQLLPSKGVPPDEVKARAVAAIKVFGHQALDQALKSKNAWGALKSLGNSKPRPFTWVHYHELQNHIQERAQSKFGAHDMKKKGRKPAKQHAVSLKHIDPTSLLLPPGLFHTNDGATLPQLNLEDVAKDARGVAFASAADVQHFIADGKLISPEGLAVLVVGPMPEGAPLGLPMHSVRVPAIYRGTNEPVILDCTSVQLGDQMVYRKTNQSAPELQVCPTKVLRLHVFKDIWEQDHAWSDFVAHPVRQLVSVFPLLRLCQDQDCDQKCGKFHPSIEEEGVESGLLDIWAFRWHKHDGSKASPDASDVLSVFIRIPESSFESVHRASGQSGFFFEPRKDDTPGPDEEYAVIWLPQLGLTEALHRVRTVDHCVAACRLGKKYGVRCVARHQETVHNELCPNKPFVACAINAVYRLEPLPAGTQRASLVAMLKSCGWQARPLQPCKGSQGQAWTVGAGSEPPQPFVEAQHGWVGISKVKDASPVAPVRGFIASSKTKQHIKGAAASSSSGSADPWQQGADPWAGYFGSSGKAPMQQHVQTRMEDVEAKLHDQLEQTITAKVQKLQDDTAHETRLAAVENQIQSLVENQGKLEHWMVDGSSKIHEVQRECSQLSQVGQQQGQTLQTVSQDVRNCSNAIGQVSQEVSGFKEGLMNHLDSYFAKQQAELDTILSKRAKHS